MESFLARAPQFESTLQVRGCYAFRHLVDPPDESRADGLSGWLNCPRSLFFRPYPVPAVMLDSRTRQGLLTVLPQGQPRVRELRNDPGVRSG